MGKSHRKKQDNLPSSNATEYIPNDISACDIRMSFWKIIVSDLKDRGVYSSTYFPTITLICHTCARLAAARPLLEEEGDIIARNNAEGEPIGVMANPRFDQVLKLEALLLKLIEKLGMSPRDIVFLTNSETSPDSLPSVQESNNSPYPGITYFQD